MLAGGARIGEAGDFRQPTVRADVPREARVFNDEPFGPVAAVRRVASPDEAIAEANRLPYGLAACAYTRSLKNADLVTRRLEVGMPWIDMPTMPSAEMPFGGIEDSGHGSEGGPEALEAYLNTESVAVMNAWAGTPGRCGTRRVPRPPWRERVGRRRAGTAPQATGGSRSISLSGVTG